MYKTRPVFYSYGTSPAGSCNRIPAVSVPVYAFLALLLRVRMTGAETEMRPVTADTGCAKPPVPQTVQTVIARVLIL